MKVLKTLTAVEKIVQAEFKAKFDMPYSESAHLSIKDRVIVRLNKYFEEFKDDAFFRLQYKKAWADVGYSEYVFDYYLYEEIDGFPGTHYCEEDAGINPTLLHC